MAIGYALCTIVFWLFPEASANFMNALFHGLDFSSPKRSGTFTFPSFAGFPSIAADAAKDGGKIVVEGKRVVELADGGEITVDDKGRTYHKDAKGKRVRMKDGVIMESRTGPSTPTRTM